MLIPNFKEFSSISYPDFALMLKTWFLAIGHVREVISPRKMICTFDHSLHPSRVPLSFSYMYHMSDIVRKKSYSWIFESESKISTPWTERHLRNFFPNILSRVPNHDLESSKSCIKMSSGSWKLDLYWSRYGLHKRLKVNLHCRLRL